jgi:predicted metalloprotease with PDZ domain
MEGLTSFYEIVALRRAGLVTPERFVAIWAERITQLWRTPGRLRTPLELASYDSWIKHYRPDESTANTSVSYYLKGSVVGFLLDLEIRRRTSGARSLDDVMRLLFERYGRPPGLPEDGVEKTASEVAGEDLRPWFEGAIRSADELDVEGALAGAGLQAVFRASSGPEDKGGAAARPPETSDTAPRAHLGALLREKGTALEVAAVLEGSPAQEAGIAAGDDIVALDGFKSDMQKRLARGQPGQEVGIALFRLDELLEVRARLAQAPRDTVTIVPDPRAAPAKVELRTAWLGALWPDGAA